MTAATNKIVLDRGSDYRLQLKVQDDDGVTNRDLTGWSWTMKIYDAGNSASPVYTPSGTFDGGFGGDNLTNGACTVHINSTETQAMDTNIPADADIFGTSYSYVYTLTISGTEGSTQDINREMRVMRGKLAVRV